MFRILKVVISAAFVAASLNTHASSEIFLRLDGIKGESTDPINANATKGIDVWAWSWNMANFGRSKGEGGGGQRASFADISLIKNIDITSPELYRLVAVGEQIASGTLRFSRYDLSSNKHFVYEELVMTDILVTSASMVGSSNGESATAVEDISLNFASFCIRYVEQTHLGGPGAKAELCWNIAINESCTAQQVEDLFKLPLVASMPPDLVHQLTPVCSDS